MPKISNEYLGSMCEVRGANNALILVGRIAEITDSYIEIRNSNNDIPVVYYNTRVKIQVYGPDNDFIMLDGFSYLSNAEFLRVTNLCFITNEERRNTFRVFVGAETEGVLSDGDSAYVDNMLTKWSPVTLDDISLGGVHITGENEWKKGDIILLKIPDMGDRVFKYRVLHRNYALGDKRLYGYGCEYVYDSKNTTTDDLCCFIFNRQRDMINHANRLTYES